MRKTLPALALLAGCSTGPGITPTTADPSVFQVVRQAAISLQLPDTVAAEAQAEATAFCDLRGAALEVVDVQTGKAWNASGNLATYKMRFRCLPRAASSTQAAGSMPR